MSTSPLRSLKVAADAKPLLDKLIARATGSEQTQIANLLVKAAGVDGNKYLTASEVQAVVDAFEQTQPTGSIAGTLLGQAVSAAETRLGSMSSLSNVDGVSANFTGSGDSLEAKLIGELNDAVTRANGRKLDVNMLIFEFQSDGIQQAIVDIAKKNPNVSFRIIGDSGQASSYGGNALPEILDLKLPNVQVKFKKDFPYIWSSSANRAVYNHNATQGLNHHKGFATFIEGKPDRLVTGSFNWSDTADDKNYEDLMVFHSMDSATRRVIEQFGDEFHGYFNNHDAAVGANELYNFKREQSNLLAQANGQTPTNFTPKPADNIPDYQPQVDTKSFDLNGLRPSDKERLTSVVGETLAKSILYDRSHFGRFASLEELKTRVPAVAQLSSDKLAALAAADFGSMQISINDATVEELDAAGFTLTSAKAIVAYREAHGDFESLDDLKNIPSISSYQLSLARKYVTATDVEGFFNSRPFGATQGGTGYGADSAGRTTPAMGSNGSVTDVAANVSVAATDLFNRAKAGQRISVAMYGMSSTAPEYRALVDAAKRGASVRVVLNDDFTASTAAALKALKAQGYDVEVRIQKARTMHEKFGVMGDDAFAGSANFSESSSTKHSENRIAVKNQPEIAQAFQAQFDLLWERSKDA